MDFCRCRAIVSSLIEQIDILGIKRFDFIPFRPTYPSVCQCPLLVGIRILPARSTTSIALNAVQSRSAAHVYQQRQSVLWFSKLRYV